MCCDNYTGEFMNNNHILTRFSKAFCVEMRLLRAREMWGFVTETKQISKNIYPASVSRAYDWVLLCVMNDNVVDVYPSLTIRLCDLAFIIFEH